MSHPILFPLHKPLAPLSFDEIRALARREGFLQQHNPNPEGSEIWLKLTPHGYAVLRLDPNGHETKHALGSAPHRHKEWVPRAQIQQYMTIFSLTKEEKDYLKRVVVLYDDQGIPIPATHHLTSGKMTPVAAAASHITSG